MHYAVKPVLAMTLSYLQSCGLLLLAALFLPACTATDQSTEQATPGTVPAEVRTDAERRAAYNSGSTNAAVPDATPNRVRLGEQAADINRAKRIESINTNDPNTTTPETRIQRLRTAAPADTLRRP